MIQSLVSWSQNNFHHLPWRQQRTLYTTLVSEIMLQQTTVGTVIQHFQRFISEYPDFKNVATASEEQLAISWKGLGYYRRARNLKSACQKIAESGKVPETLEELKLIPGIGDYTAGAILGIGMNRPFLAIDGNLERVIARLYGLALPKGEKLKKLILQKFQQGEICQEIHAVGGRAYNEALMDLGRNFCQAQKATCHLCPLKGNCVAFASGQVNSIPSSDGTVSKSHSLQLLRLVIQNQNKIFVYQKSDKQWLSGQWEVPTYILNTDDPKLSQYPKIDSREEFELLPSFKGLITKYKIENKVLALDLSEVKKLQIDLPQGQWINLDQGNHNISIATKRAIEL